MRTEASLTLRIKRHVAPIKQWHCRQMPNIGAGKAPAML